MNLGTVKAAMNKMEVGNLCGKRGIMFLSIISPPPPPVYAFDSPLVKLGLWEWLTCKFCCLLQEAEVCYKNAIKFRKKYPDAYFNLGNLVRKIADPLQGWDTLRDKSQGPLTTIILHHVHCSGYKLQEQVAFLVILAARPDTWIKTCLISRNLSQGKNLLQW